MLLITGSENTSAPLSGEDEGTAVQPDGACYGL